jgi:4-alpha-glucanotransferase
MDTLPPELVELAHGHGVATGFHDWQGHHTVVPAATVVAVLRALGVDADGPDAVRRSLADLRDAPWRRMLPATVVVRAGVPRQVPVHVPHGDPVDVWVRTEEGDEVPVSHVDRWTDPREVDGRLVGEATVEVPRDLPLGWHTLHARSLGVEATATLVVTPGYLGLGDDLLSGPPRWGFMTQLYALRSRRSWGHGDLDDLGELARWSGEQLGAGFVLVNPLHAPAPVAPVEPSPYLPVTRRFVSPLYLRVEDVPEFAYLTGAVRAEVERTALLARSVNEADVLLDRDAVWEAKRSALTLVHAVTRSPGRQADYEDFVAREGEGLDDFATWCALVEVHGPDWTTWPVPLRDPRGPSVAEARAELADRVDFYRWLQWLLDGQLAAAQQRAVDSGMEIGVVHDLAVGVHPTGADSWALQGVLAEDVTVGAPPDAFNQQGQDWSQPPWRPDALAATGYAPYRDMLRTVLRHSGGVRVDHVLGLFRLWWVPRGTHAGEGTYVRYDHEALVGILALEAWRAGALVVGEDLGTVEPWVRQYLAERGILGTSILWFERDGEGRPLPPERWRELCLATVTTHDLPPTAGYLDGEHVRVRAGLGLLTRPEDEERAVDAEEQGSWLGLLADEGLLPPGADEQTTVEALHAALARTPSRLLGVALTDAVGDRRAVNQPGTSDEYPNWRLPVADGSGRPVLLEDLVDSTRARSLAEAVRGRTS